MGAPISCAVSTRLTRLHNTTSEAAAILRHTTGKGRKALDGGSFKQRAGATSFLGVTSEENNKNTTSVAAGLLFCILRQK